MIACPNCEFVGYLGDCKPAPVPALQPGETYVAPYGLCPACCAVIPADAPHADAYGKIARRWRDLPAERSNLTKFQRDCLVSALAHITPDHPGFTGSDEVAYLLKNQIPRPEGSNWTFATGGINHYIDSWVRPMIEAALYGPGFHDQPHYAAQDANRARAALDRENGV